MFLRCSPEERKAAITNQAVMNANLKIAEAGVHDAVVKDECYEDRRQRKQ